MRNSELLKLLAKSAVEKRLLLFVGSGLSKCIVGKQNALSWVELLIMVAKKFGLKAALTDLKSGAQIDCPKIASDMVDELWQKAPYYSKVHCDSIIKEYVCALCDWYPDKDQKDYWRSVFSRISPSGVITTNYDHVIEEILEEASLSFSADNTLPILTEGECLVYHLHGVRHQPQGIVLTREDYLKAMWPFSYRQTRLTTLLRENSVLYVGYAHNDINMLSALDVSNETFLDVGLDNANSLQVKVIYDDKLEGSDWTISAEDVSQGKKRQTSYEIRCRDVALFMTQLADECEEMKREERNKLESFLDDIKKMTEEADEKDVSQRRETMRLLFKNNIALLNANSKLAREFQREFNDYLKGYYRLLRKEAKKPANWERYADAWSLLFAYFSVLATSECMSNGKIAPHTRLFAYAIGWFNGISWFFGDDIGKAKTAYKWFKEDWKALSPEVRDLIIDSAKRKDYKEIEGLIEKVSKEKDVIANDEDAPCEE